MLAWISIRWRITLFHIVTMLGIAALLTIGMFAVFGIAVSNSIEATAESRANEAARIVETTGTLTTDDLMSLSRDGVFIVALDAGGRVVTQVGAGVAEGDLSDAGRWRDVLAVDEGRGSGERALFTRWDDEAVYTYAEPVRSENSGIRVVEAGANYDQVGQSQFMWVTFAFVGFGILAFVLVTIGSIFLVRYSLSPVTAIAEAAAEIGAADLSQRLPVRSGRDELGHLAMTFNALLDRLETAFADREEALAHQRRFVADASHELRTPLTSILGYTRMLRDWGVEHPEATAEAVARMETEAARMQSLVEGLLHLARGDEAGPGAISNVDLGQLVLAAVDLAAVGQERDLGFDLQLPASPVSALVDREAILQVLAILLDNAVKYSPAEGTITITLSAATGTAVMTVADSGPGIAPEHRERIFDRFYRVDESRSTRGAGLGLAIAKDIVDRHEGSILVTSEPGMGAVFSVRLPHGPPGAHESPPM
ncbi:MAG: HAMP domain-containing histidine kinase [Chloroflexota bacterium]|nr:HAMP domain-containing histidine kinase [Chloroflexota bacterium]